MERCNMMFVIRGVGGFRRVLVILFCILVPFSFIFLIRGGGNNESSPRQMITSREVSYLAGLLL